MSADPSDPPSQAVVQITMGRIYDVATETRADVRDLKGLVSGVVEHVNDLEARTRVIERNKVDQADVDDLEKRVAIIERDKADKADVVVKADKAEVAALETRTTTATTKLDGRVGRVEIKVWIGTGIGLVAASGCSGLAVYLLTAR